MKKLMQCCCHKDFGLFLLRFTLALVFMGHGLSKFQGMDQTIIFFSSFGLGAFWAYAVATVELLGGTLMLLGIGTQYAGFALATIMVFSTILVKLKMGYAYAELDITLFGLALGTALVGPGKWSLARKLCGCGSCALCGCCGVSGCDGCHDCKGGLCTGHEKILCDKCAMCKDTCTMHEAKK